MNNLIMLHSHTTYLSREELCELARRNNRQTPSVRTVKRFLDHQNWPYVLGLDGWPRVLRAYHDSIMRGERTCPASAEPQWTVAA